MRRGPPVGRVEPGGYTTEDRPAGGCRMPDTGYRMPDARCRMPDTGCRMPDARWQTRSPSAVWSGQRETGNGKRETENGKRKTENGKLPAPHPLLPAFPVLLLPDRCRRLEFVDEEPGCGECLGGGAGRGGPPDRDLPHPERSETMHRGDADDVMTTPGIGHDRPDPVFHHLPIGLVLEVGNHIPTLR